MLLYHYTIILWLGNSSIRLCDYTNVLFYYYTPSAAGHAGKPHRAQRSCLEASVAVRFAVWNWLSERLQVGATRHNTTRKRCTPNRRSPSNPKTPIPKKTPTPNPKPQTLNPKPQTLNPKPQKQLPKKPRAPAGRGSCGTSRARCPWPALHTAMASSPWRQRICRV